jgi:phosphoglycerate kinase
MNKKTIRDVDLRGKRVLVRVDFNVPLSEDEQPKAQAEKAMKVDDDTRIREAIPTLQYIMEQQPRYIVLMTHLGRPEGKIVPSMSVKPIIPVLSAYLGVEVLLAPDSVGKYADEVIENASEGAVILLQNTRYYAGESKNDPEYAAKLAKYGDILVNDAFGTAHRAHASNVGVANFMPSVAGFLMEKEIDFLVTALESPRRPFVAIMGGAKVSDKVPVIRALIQQVDRLIVGGGIAITFLKAAGYEVERSLVDVGALAIAEELLTHYGDKIVLPFEVVAANEFKDEAQQVTVDIRKERIPENWQILDAAKGSIDQFRAILKTAGTILWNGPVGVFEMPNFAQGTFGIANILADLTDKGAITIIGGGDSASAVEKAGLTSRMTHVSTGGGASLELLEGLELPGLAILQDR